MYYINKLYEQGYLSFKTTNTSIIEELLEYYVYDNNISIDINKYNCSIRTTFKVDKDEVNECTTLYNDNVPLTTWNVTIGKDQLQDVIDDEYYNRFYNLERC